MNKPKLFIALIVSFIFAITVQAQDMAIGVAAKGSTLGFGGDLVFKFHKRMDVRFGYDYLNLQQKVVSIEEQDVQLDVNVDYQNSMFSFMYDFFLSKRFFVTAGFNAGKFEPSFHGIPTEDMPWGDITIPQENLGDFSFKLSPKSSVVPYLGLGVGQTISSDGLVSFAFEVGSYYQGAPDVEIVANGLMAPTADPLNRQAETFEDGLQKYSFYPVMRFSLGFKLWSNNNSMEL